MGRENIQILQINVIKRNTLIETEEMIWKEILLETKHNWTINLGADTQCQEIIIKVQWGNNS